MNNRQTPLCGTTETSIQYLTEYFKAGVGRSAVKTAFSTLSSLTKHLRGISFGKASMVSKLLRRVFVFRPALPRYGTTWNIGKVF